MGQPMPRFVPGRIEAEQIGPELHARHALEEAQGPLPLRALPQGSKQLMSTRGEQKSHGGWGGGREGRGREPK